MKLWLDDQINDPDTPDRHAPAGWKGVTNASHAIALIAKGIVEEIDFDHDLGDAVGVGTGYDVAKYIEAAAYHKEITPIKWSIHSANPVGRRNITGAMVKAEMFWNKEN